MRRPLFALLSAAVLAAGIFTGPATAQTRPPLMIASQGYLFVGGELTTTGKQPLANQMYVEYQIPAQRLHKYPIVMIEGGGQTGANFTGTPDGREGWAQYFLRRGYAVQQGHLNVHEDDIWHRMRF